MLERVQQLERELENYASLFIIPYSNQPWPAMTSTRRLSRISFGGRPTNLDLAIDEALEVNTKSVRKVVVLTDECYSVSDFISLKEKLRHANVEMYCEFFAQPDNSKIVSMESPNVPFKKTDLWSTDVVVDIQSSNPDSIDLVTSLMSFSGDTLAKLRRTYPASPGRNVFHFNSVALENSLDDIQPVHIQLEETGQDSVPANNVSQGIIKIADRPRVLFVEDILEVNAIEEILRRKNFPYRKYQSQNLPRNPSVYNAYNLVVFNNVQSTTIDSQAIHALRTFVHDLGGGLAVINFDPGYDQIKEFSQMLPVYAVEEGRRKGGRKFLALMADVSYCVNAQAVGRLRSEYQRVLRELMNSDERYFINLVVYGDRNFPIRSFTARNENREQMQRLLDQVERIPPPKGEEQSNHVEALRRVQREASRRSNELDGGLIWEDTEGIWIDSNDRDILEEFEQNNISHLQVHGSTTSQRVQTSLQQIEIDNSIQFLPLRIVRPHHQLLRPFNSDDLPANAFYQATRIKNRALKLIEFEENQSPLLAEWRYGAGLVVAYTSDGSNITRDRRYETFWANLFIWAAREIKDEKFIVEYTKPTCKLTVILPEEYEGISPELGGMLTSVQDDTTKQLYVSLAKVAPKTYQSKSVELEFGGYFASLVYNRNGELNSNNGKNIGPGFAPQSLFVPTSEFLESLYFKEKLIAASEYTGGGETPSRYELQRFTQSENRQDLQHEWWYIPLMIGLVLFFVEIIAREIKRIEVVNNSHLTSQ